MQLASLLDAIATSLSEQMPDLAACRPCDGEIDATTLGPFSDKTPALFLTVSALGEQKAQPEGTWNQPVKFTAHLVVGGPAGTSILRQTLDHLERLLEIIPGSRWKEPLVEAAGPCTGTPVFSGKQGEKTLALWRVSWNQTVRLGADAFATDLPKPSAIYLGKAPDIGCGHEADYQEVAP